MPFRRFFDRGAKDASRQAPPPAPESENDELETDESAEPTGDARDSADTDDADEIAPGENDPTGARAPERSSRPAHRRAASAPRPSMARPMRSGPRTTRRQSAVVSSIPTATNFSTAPWRSAPSRWDMPSPT